MKDYQMFFLAGVIAISNGWTNVALIMASIMFNTIAISLYIKFVKK